MYVYPLPSTTVYAQIISDSVSVIQLSELFSSDPVP